jgi:tetratricopeptide (TPR) repeat protein
VSLEQSALGDAHFAFRDEAQAACAVRMSSRDECFGASVAKGDHDWRKDRLPFEETSKRFVRMGRSITPRPEPMKPSRGRTHRSAALVAASVVSFALAAFASVAAHAQTPPAVRDDTPEIDTSIASQNWSAALSELDARIASHPQDAQAKFKRGTVLARLNRDDDAIRQFVELTQLYPELPEPYNNLAALYAKHGRYEDARAALDTAVKANPSYGLAYENLGDLYLHLAEQSYKRAQSLGHASPAAAQRVAAIDAIVAPGAAPASASPAGAGVPRKQAAPPAMHSPGAEFGGSNGPFPAQPYIAPSR